MKRQIKTVALIALFAGVASILSGCYERVVSARGFGSERIAVEEPYQESGEIDKWIFGDDAATKRTPR